MVAKQNPFVGRFEIVAVAKALRRRGSLIVERHHFRRDKLPVKAEANQEKRSCRGNQPQAVDGFAARVRNGANANSGGNGQGCPEDPEQMTTHIGLRLDYNLAMARIKAASSENATAARASFPKRELGMFSSSTRMPTTGAGPAKRRRFFVYLS